MKIDTTTVIKDLDGEAMTDPKGELSLRRVIQNALLAVHPEDTKMDGEEKVSLFKLAQAAATGEVDWSPEDLAKVRHRIGKAYGPAVVGPAFALLG